MPFSIRLDEDLRKRIGRLARERGIRPSQLVRKAIEDYMARESSEPAPFELAGDLLGSVRSGHGGLSAIKGRELREIVGHNAARKRNRRAH